MEEKSTKYTMDTVQTVDVEKLRKLPVFWRKMNVLYQFLMILIAFANVILTVVDANDNTTIPKLYFQIYSCVISLSFVAWNRMLDAVKEYQDTLTEPTQSTPLVTNADTGTTKIKMAKAVSEPDSPPSESSEYPEPPDSS